MNKDIKGRQPEINMHFHEIQSPNKDVRMGKVRSSFLKLNQMINMEL